MDIRSRHPTSFAFSRVGAAGTERGKQGHPRVSCAACCVGTVQTFLLFSSAICHRELIHDRRRCPGSCMAFARVDRAKVSSVGSAGSFAPSSSTQVHNSFSRGSITNDREEGIFSTRSGRQEESERQKRWGLTAIRTRGLSQTVVNSGCALSENHTTRP